MLRRYSQLLWVAVLGAAHTGGAFADDVIHRYEGNVVPYDESAGWEGNACEAPCSETIEDGHLVLRFAYAWNSAGYRKVIAQEPDTTPPPTLWAEWRFRSNHPLGLYSYTCDASFTVDYRDVFEWIEIYGDAVISSGANHFVTGLDIGEFHTYRFESLDGTNYSFSVDGFVFHGGADEQGNERHKLAFSSRGGCLGTSFRTW